MKMNVEQITFLENWIVSVQKKLGNGLGEGLLIHSAMVLWEGSI